METAWLVEKSDDHGVCWLTAYLGQLTFSYDVNDAIRFSREQDAAQIAEELFTGVAKASEHMWG